MSTSGFEHKLVVIGWRIMYELTKSYLFWQPEGVVVDFPVDYEKVYVNLRKANLYPTLGDAMIQVMCEK